MILVPLILQSRWQMAWQTMIHPRNDGAWSVRITEQHGLPCMQLRRSSLEKPAHPYTNFHIRFWVKYFPAVHMWMQQPSLHSSHSSLRHGTKAGSKSIPSLIHLTIEFFSLHQYVFMYRNLGGIFNDWKVRAKRNYYSVNIDEGGIKRGHRFFL